VTVDHVVPKCLFQKAVHAAIQVPACNECNNAKSNYDSQLRDLLAISVENRQHPNAAVIQADMYRSVEYGYSRIGKLIQSQSNAFTFVHVAGELQEITSVTDDSGFINVFAEFLIKGFHRRLTGQTLSPDHYVYASFAGPFKSPLSILLTHRFDSAPMHVVTSGEGVFQCKTWHYVRSATDEHMMAWVITNMSNSQLVGISGSD
jgi:hypothetical protein